MRTISAHRKDVHGLAFSPDGRILASVGGQSAAVWLWDTRTGELVRKLPGRRDRGRAIAFSPDGHYIAAADNRNLVRVWRLPDGQPEAEFSVHRLMPAHDLVFLPDGKTIVTASEKMRVWRLGTYDPPYLESPSSERWFDAVAPSPDGTVLAFGSQSAVGCWWFKPNTVRLLTEVRAGIHSLAFAPTEDLLAVAFGHTVRVLDIRTGDTVLALEGHQGMVWKVTYTPDGTRLVTSSSDGSVRFWESATGAPRGSFDWQTGKVRCIAVSPDGLTVASGGQDGRIIIADVDP